MIQLEPGKFYKSEKGEKLMFCGMRIGMIGRGREPHFAFWNERKLDLEWYGIGGYVELITEWCESDQCQ